MSPATDPLLVAIHNDERHDFHSSDQEVSLRKDNEFSPFTAVCFTLNYAVGTGFLVLPWAFLQGGVVLTLLVLVFTSIIANITKDLLLESMARAEALNSPGLPDNSDGNLAVRNDRTEIMDENSAEDSTGSLIVGDRLFEMQDIVRIFLGDKGAYLFVMMIAAVGISCLTAYTIFFSSSLASNFPLAKNNDADYYIYTAVFAGITIPLACIELTEQKLVQTLLTGGRVIIFIFMISTVLLFPDDFEGTPKSGDDESKSGGSTKSPQLFGNSSGIYRMIPVVVYAFTFFLGIPGISHSVKKKEQLSGIFQSAIFICLVAYSVLGIILVFGIGDNIKEQSNLNWKSFRGGTGKYTEDGKWEDVAWWASFISYYVQLFPVMDVVSAFPLLAIPIGNSYLVTVYGKHGNEILLENRKVRVMFRLFACVPSIILAAVFQSVGPAVDYCGTFMVLAAICFPAMISICSKRSGITRKTHYGTFFTNNDFFAFALTCLGMVLFVYLLLSLLFNFS